MLLHPGRHRYEIDMYMIGMVTRSAWLQDRHGYKIDMGSLGASTDAPDRRNPSAFVLRSTTVMAPVQAVQNREIIEIRGDEDDSGTADSYQEGRGPRRFVPTSASTASLPE
ncbi:unnamed protein product [Phytophthora fragariaefolia]|uniref:Unnamed protein product n=1 Tax=Phytophthora fragariaefolia TaxID=1490495 RepID=A0A9W7CY34_9STRA|nr:unnamed protein product [Phytophthora fragariaefolia]